MYSFYVSIRLEFVNYGLESVVCWFLLFAICSSEIEQAPFVLLRLYSLYKADLELVHLIDIQSYVPLNYVKIILEIIKTDQYTEYIL